MYLDNEPMYKYCFLNGIGKFNNSVEVNRSYFDLSLNEVEIELSKGTAIETAKGGLIKGSVVNPDGGIYAFIQIDEVTFRFYAELVSGDYITKSVTAKNYYNQLLELEQKNTIDNILNYNNAILEIPEECKFINTEDQEICFLILRIDTQFVLSKATVKNHIKRIVELENLQS